jgi:PIN domain nuclease of toxin-antitoxin system
MIAAIADTHSVILYLFSDPRLGKAASAFIDVTITNGDHIGVSAITIAEMIYLTEKGRSLPTPSRSCMRRRLIRKPSCGMSRSMKRLR